MERGWASQKGSLLARHKLQETWVGTEAGPTKCIPAEHFKLRCFEFPHLKIQRGTSLEVQWLGLHTSTVGGMGSIPSQGTKILHDIGMAQNFF